MAKFIRNAKSNSGLLCLTLSRGGKLKLVNGLLYTYKPSLERTDEAFNPSLSKVVTAVITYLTRCCCASARIKLRLSSFGAATLLWACTYMYIHADRFFWLMYCWCSTVQRSFEEMNLSARFSAPRVLLCHREFHEFHFGIRV